MKKLAALLAVAVLGVGTTAASSGAASNPPGSRVVHVVAANGTTTILVLRPGESLFVNRSQVKVTRPNGSVAIVGLDGFRRMTVSKAQ